MEDHTFESEQYLYLYEEDPRWFMPIPEKKEKEEQRGVIIIDLFGDDE